MAREWRVTAALALVIGLMGLVWAQRAAAEEIAGGTTQIELSRGLFKALKKDGVQLSKVGPGKVAGRLVSLPASGGQIDLATANGWIDSGGGFRFRAAKRRVKVTQLTVDTSKGAVWAAVGGTKLKLAAIPSYDFSREGFGDAIEATGLRLTSRASSVLNRKLGLDAFRPGRTFASVSSSLQAPEVQITSGSFRLDLDPGTVAKIESLGFEVSPIASSGGVSEPLVFSAPLLAGRIDPTMAHTWGLAEGGFRIADPDSPGPTVEWWHLGLSFETGKVPSSGFAHSEDGQVAPGVPGPLAAVDLNPATVAVDPVARTVTVSGARATLEAHVANYVNQVFAIDRGKEPVLAAGDPLGTVSMTMQGR